MPVLPSWFRSLYRRSARNERECLLCECLLCECLLCATIRPFTAASSSFCGHQTRSAKRRKALESSRDSIVMSACHFKNDWVFVRTEHCQQNLLWTDTSNVHNCVVAGDGMDRVVEPCQVSIHNFIHTPVVFVAAVCVSDADDTKVVLSYYWTALTRTGKPPFIHMTSVQW